MRGCQKRVIYMKNTGSEVFDEAYFVVRDGYAHTSAEVDFLKEANRIVEENSCGGVKKKWNKKTLLRNAVIFALGFICAALPAVFIILFM